MPSLNHGHLSSLYNWNDDIRAEPWNEMETRLYLTLYEHVQLPQCCFTACASIILGMQQLHRTFISKVDITWRHTVAMV